MGHTLQSLQATALMYTTAITTCPCSKTFIYMANVLTVLRSNASAKVSFPLNGKSVFRCQKGPSPTGLKKGLRSPPQTASHFQAS